ncbi:MAG: nucleotidyl transferase AbiEii/AbiGii toxin family protein [Bacteroidales bacterium]|nr:nucleotidyl transferase AbiEii/AbiGii toxin family protein [Bacteroidales bacterium]
MKNSIVTLNSSDRALVISQTSQRVQLPPNVVEKDWWVTAVLRALLGTSCSKHVSFKGGTSLSKAWGVIERFSEDVDIAISPVFFGIEPTTRSQRLKLRKECRTFLTDNLSGEIADRLNEMGARDFEVVPMTRVNTKEGEVDIDGDKDPTVLLIKYHSVLSSSLQYVQPMVKLEISCLSMSEPTEKRLISSIIAQQFPQIESSAAFEMATVVPTRTFLEKAFLLNEEYQKQTPRSLRMSRHLYDLERLMDTRFAEEALKDAALYKAVMEHRRTFYAIKQVDYDTNAPSRIRIVPPQDSLHDWQEDYAQMRKTFIYGESLSFDELIVRMEQLQEWFHGLVGSTTNFEL